MPDIIHSLDYYTGRKAHTVFSTITITSMASKSAFLPWKLPVTGETCEMFRATATGIKLGGRDDLKIEGGQPRVPSFTGTQHQSVRTKGHRSLVAIDGRVIHGDGRHEGDL